MFVEKGAGGHKCVVSLVGGQSTTGLYDRYHMVSRPHDARLHRRTVVSALLVQSLISLPHLRLRQGYYPLTEDASGFQWLPMAILETGRHLPSQLLASIFIWGSSSSFKNLRFRTDRQPQIYRGGQKCTMLRGVNLIHRANVLFELLHGYPLSHTLHMWSQYYQAVAAWRSRWIWRYQHLNHLNLSTCNEVTGAERCMYWNKSLPPKYRLQ